MIPKYEQNEYVKINGRKYLVRHIRHKKKYAKHKYNFLNLNPAKTDL